MGAGGLSWYNMRKLRDVPAMRCDGMGRYALRVWFELLLSAPVALVVNKVCWTWYGRVSYRIQGYAMPDLGWARFV